MMTDLSEEDRKAAQEQAKKLLFMLGQCEMYLRDYAAGAQNLIKFFGVMYYTETALVEVRNELAKIHGLTAEKMNPPV
jgi:phage tail tape-measure protein